MTHSLDNHVEKNRFEDSVFCSNLCGKEQMEFGTLNIMFHVEWKATIHFQVMIKIFICEADVVAHTINPSTFKAEAGNHYEFEDSQFYIANFRPARSSTLWDSVSKKTKQKAIFRSY